MGRRNRPHGFQKAARRCAVNRRPDNKGSLRPTIRCRRGLVGRRFYRYRDQRREAVNPRVGLDHGKPMEKSAGLRRPPLHKSSEVVDEKFVWTTVWLNHTPGCDGLPWARNPSPSTTSTRKARTYCLLRTPSNVSQGSALRSSMSLACRTALCTSRFCGFRISSLLVPGALSGALSLPKSEPNESGSLIKWEAESGL